LGLVVFVGMALAPIGATYHMLLTVLPLALLLCRLDRGRPLLLALWVAIGFLPYRVARELGELWWPLAWPRLWLLWALALCVVALIQVDARGRVNP